MQSNKLLTVPEACELHAGALDFNPSDQVEHLESLLKDSTEKAEAFFEKNHVTSGMKTLLKECLERLSGLSSQAVFELRQAMGGGKTHSMLALGRLARNPEMFQKIPPEITANIGKSHKSRVVAINGRSISKNFHLWGDIANQFDKKEEFSPFWKDIPTAPTEEDWKQLIGDEPTLILLDELPPYFNYAVTRQIGEGTLATVTTYALSNLLSAAMKLSKTAIVVSNLTGSYQEATQGLTDTMKKALKKNLDNISGETKRGTRSITPVDLSTNEIYAILKKRMFSKLPDKKEIEKIANAYGDAIHKAVRSKTISKSSEQVAEEIMASYPFHPSVKHIIALFKENENYRQTRGLMQFVSKMLKSVWHQKGKGNRKTQGKGIYLIGCQHLDLHIEDVKDEVGRIGKLEGALARDVASTNGSAHAETIDANKGGDSATQTAKLLLTASLSENIDSVKGLSKSTLIEYLITPDRDSAEFDEAFENLQKECWYLHKKDNDNWYFSKLENLRKRIESKAEKAPQHKIDAELKRRLENIFEPRTKSAYVKVIALPLIDEVTLNAHDRLCLVLPPDRKDSLKEAEAFFETQVYKNGVCFVTGDFSSSGNLEDKVRRIWAVAKVTEELSGQLAHKQELEEEAEQAELDFNTSVYALFNRVYYPMQRDEKPKLTHTKFSLVGKQSGSSKEINGEKAVEEALSASNAKKLILEIQPQMNSLIQRAEDVLWPSSQTQTRWQDVVERAQSNPRWLWIPPRGLKDLRDQAVSEGRWSYDDSSGYVDKKPPQPKTGLNITDQSYDEETGEAELVFFPQNAGETPIIRMSETPKMDEQSEKLDSKKSLKTKATKLWFKVEDPTGQNEAGDMVTWNNKLHLTYEPQYLPDKRIVKLHVVPRGEIRWNTKGINPKEGKVYKSGEPIKIKGTEEVTLYAYAEDQGISVAKTFKIKPSSDTPQSIAPEKKVELKKELHGDSTKSSFDILNAIESDPHVELHNVSLTVGSGSSHVQIRFGSEAPVSAQHIKESITWARSALNRPDAEVHVTIPRTTFSKGFHFTAFADTLGENIAPKEVEQE